MKFSPFGNDLFGNPISFADGVISKKFEFPPFSVLDARQGEWQDRKRSKRCRLLGRGSKKGKKVAGRMK